MRAEIRDTMTHRYDSAGDPLDSRPRRAGKEALRVGAVVLGALAVACREEPETIAAQDGVLRGTLIHLDAELARAHILCASAPERAEPTWSFGELEKEWSLSAGSGVALEPGQDALRLVFTPAADAGGMPPFGGIQLDFEGGALGRWSGLEVRARTRDRIGGITAVVNPGAGGRVNPFFFFGGDEGSSPVFSDGSVQTYHLPFQERGEGGELEGFGLLAASLGPAALDVLSITLVPRGGDFELDHGVRAVTRDSVTRTTLYAHTPASFAWRVAVPAGGRIDVGLAALPGETIGYSASLRAERGEHELLDERVADGKSWRQVSLDLARFAGQEAELTLAATSAFPGAVALWGAPILSCAAAGSEGTAAGSRPRPNVVFYVIDGGGADLMSVYGYTRATTPFLENLAAEGVVFERAHSNSTWTQSSTASFMTGLQHSVLGGLRRGMHSTPVPLAAVTMAEHLRRGGWQTAAFTSNPNAGRLIGLERGLDVMRDAKTGHHSTSSTDLHELYWRFRADYPGGPTWVHFQTTDVHEPNEPVAPFAGRFVPEKERQELAKWDDRIFTEAGELFGTTSIAGFYDAALKRTGIDRRRYFEARRGLYDETMAYQDRELERFVATLKERGEWENTLLVIASDHGHPAGTFARFGRGLIDPQPEEWQGALCDAYATRVPLVFVWPARIAGGRRSREAVSMIDVLPTILELLGLPQAEVAQGRSLAPFLLANEPVPHEVLLDEFRADEATGEMIGNLEIVDGRWGASLELGPVPAGADPARGRRSVPAGGRWGVQHPFFPDVPRLLLYDLEQDPFATHAVNDEHPELVQRYEALLRERWNAHRALAQRFAEAADAPLDTEQLEQLKALGYVR
jgi:arylsulfatase A-like enzyme